MTTTPNTATGTAARLSAADLERLELATRADLTGAVVNLTRLREGSAHEVAGFPTWHDYVVARFGDLLAELRGTILPVPERQELVLSMRSGGPDGKALSLRTIADRLNVGLGTVSADVGELRAAGRLTAEPTRTASRDGRDRPARTGTDVPARAVVVPLAAPTGRVWQQATEWLRRADEGVLPGFSVGLTLVELARVAGWTEGKASGALTDVQRRGTAVRLEDRRADQRVHVITDGGRAMLADLAAPPVDAEPVVDHGARFVWESGDVLTLPLTAP